MPDQDETNSTPTINPETPEAAPPLVSRRSLSLGAGAAASAFIEAACAAVVAAKSSALFVGAGAFASSAFIHWAHQPAVRYPLLGFAALGAGINLAAMWRAWRLRRNPASQWRLQPLTRREKLRIRFVVGISLLTLALLAAEVLAHRSLFGEL